MSSKSSKACLLLIIGALIVLPSFLLTNGPAIAETKVTEGVTALPNRNLVNTTAKNLPSEWDPEEGTNIKWKAKLGETSYGGPVIAAGKVFVGTNNASPRDPNKKGDLGVLMCFNQSDGKFLWQITHEKLESEEEDFPRQGVGSSPVVEGNYLYYVSNRAEVVCAHVDGDGKGGPKVIWTYDMIKELKIFPCYLAMCSPLIVGDKVYVATGNGANEMYKLPKPDAPSFLALNKKTGKFVWSDNSPGKNIMQGQWASPTFANPGGKEPQVIFPGGDGWLYSFSTKNHKLLWKFNGNKSTAKYIPMNQRLSERCYFLASPVIYDNKCYIGVGDNPDHGGGVGHFWCIDITKKPKGEDKDLSPKNDNFDPKAEVNKDSGLVWHFGGRIMPKPKDGRELYIGRTMSTVAIHDDLVYVAELDGYFHCLDAKTGKRHWVHDLTTGIWSSAYYADGKVYLGTDDGEVVVLQVG